MRLKNVIDWFCLINTRGIGPKTFWELLKKYNTPETALKYVKDPFPLQEAKKIINSFKGKILLASDDIFPNELKRDNSCPPILYTMGNLDILKYPKLAIIGARNASINGKSIARNFGYNLSNYYVITSGLAVGIDTSAHLGALKNENSKVIAVMPFSLDNVFPKENKDLFKKIIEKGLAISEVPPYRPPAQDMFFARNKILASISQGIVVVEAALKSGTMSTAKLALELGCDVMAVPGSPADPRARGCNNLIRNGAPLVENYVDVLNNMNMDVTTKNEENIELNTTVSSSKHGLNQKILNMLSVDSPTSIDLIASNLDLNVPEVLCNISELEMLGRIRKCSVNEVVLNV